MRLNMIKLVLLLLALLVAVILVAPQVDLDPILPAQQAGYLVVVLLILAVMVRSASPLAFATLAARHCNSQLRRSGSSGLTPPPLRC